jgi:hypothetical protein
MTGGRQNFILRFVQKGCRILGDGKIVRCWVYQQNKSPRPANIHEIGLERHFYATKCESDLDDKITDQEQGVYAPLLYDLHAVNLSEVLV